MRYGAGYWCAHLFIDDVQQCTTRHGQYMPRPGGVLKKVVTDLTPHGVPYGKVCQRCHRVYNGNISGIKR